MNNVVSWEVPSARYGAYRVLIDEADLLRVAEFTWCVIRSAHRNALYVRTRGPRPRREIVFLHRLILAVPPGLHTDHINGNGLDNRRANLRVCTTQQNNLNRGLQRDSISGLKGASLRNGRWIAHYTYAGRTRYIGTFDTAEAAHEAYVATAAPLHGAFFNSGRQSA